MTELQFGTKTISTQLRNGSQTLIEPRESIILLEVIISKGSNGRTTLNIEEGDFKRMILFVDTEGTHQFSFNNGFKFWQGGKLTVDHNADGVTLLTIVYKEAKGHNQMKWRVDNGG